MTPKSPITATAALLALFVAAPAPAQTDMQNQRSIMVTGQGEASARPDIATINAGVQTRAASAIEAASRNQAAVEKVMAALEDQGIAEKDIQTSNYSIWPEQRRQPRGDDEVVIDGFRVSNSVAVRVRDLDRLGELLAAVTNAGANSINGINFAVEDTAALEARAREAAMQDARRRAESLAELAGVELGDVQQIAMTAGGGYPRPIPMARMEAMAMDAAPAPSIAPGESSMTVNVQVTYAIR
jgi:uncharacterized protein YggE